MTETAAGPFFGRERLLREIVDGVLAAQPMDFALIAPKFGGKTRMLQHLASPDGPLHSVAFAQWRPEDFQRQQRVISLLINCNWPDARADLLGFLARELAARLHQDNAFQVDWDQVTREDSASRQLWLMATCASEAKFRIVLMLNNFDVIIADKLLSHHQINELRPLTPELALVIGTKQPLNDIDTGLESSPLLQVLRPLYIGLLERDGAAAWIESYRQAFPELSPELSEPLLQITGMHPFLLARLRETLLEVQKMASDDRLLEPSDFPLIELRLAEHGRLLFESLARTLDHPPARVSKEQVDNLLADMLEGPIALQPDDAQTTVAISWLISQAVLLYDKGYYQLFSPLFASYLRNRSPESVTERRIEAQVASPTRPSIVLPRIERQLLEYLRDNSNRVVSPQDLLVEVWKLPADTSERRVQEAIRRLRSHLREIEPSIGIIENERGLGYRFIPL